VAPVVTSIPGNTDIVVHEQSGLLVPPADPSALAAAILRLYNDGDFRRKLAHQARQRIETEFHISTTIREMKKLYEEMTGQTTG
jgi:glycosyltransferase involved in cell wall biosynthesis